MNMLPLTDLPFLAYYHDKRINNRAFHRYVADEPDYLSRWLEAISVEWEQRGGQALTVPTLNPQTEKASGCDVAIILEYDDKGYKVLLLEGKRIKAKLDSTQKASDAALGAYGLYTPSGKIPKTHPKISHHSDQIARQEVWLKNNPSHVIYEMLLSFGRIVGSPFDTWGSTLIEHKYSRARIAPPKSAGKNSNQITPFVKWDFEHLESVANASLKTRKKIINIQDVLKSVIDCNEGKLCAFVNNKIDLGNGMEIPKFRDRTTNLQTEFRAFPVDYVAHFLGSDTLGIVR